MYLEYWQRRRWLVRCLWLGLRRRRPNRLGLRYGSAGRDIMRLLLRLRFTAGMDIAVPWFMGTDTTAGMTGCMATATDGVVMIDAMTGVAGAIVTTGAAGVVMIAAMIAEDGVGARITAMVIGDTGKWNEVREAAPLERPRCFWG